MKLKMLKIIVVLWGICLVIGSPIPDPGVKSSYQVPFDDGSGSYEDDDANYSFEYAVSHSYSGNSYGHKERRTGDFTRGVYYVLLPDGRVQKVSYYVDGGSGFVAKVSYEDGAGYKDSSHEKSGEFHRKFGREGSEEDEHSKEVHQTRKQKAKAIWLGQGYRQNKQSKQHQKQHKLHEEQIQRQQKQQFKQQQEQRKLLQQQIAKQKFLQQQQQQQLQQQQKLIQLRLLQQYYLQQHEQEEYAQQLEQLRQEVLQHQLQKQRLPQVDYIVNAEPIISENFSYQ